MEAARKEVALAKKIYLHIGTHKTGSTAIQRCVHENLAALLVSGVDSYGRVAGKANHSEVYLAVMNKDRDSFAKLRSGKNYGEKFRRKTQEAVSSFIECSAAKKLLFSTEGLSLLRFDEELSSLRSLLNADENDVEVIVYIRDRLSFLRSYRQQILKDPGRNFSTDKMSVLYAADDSWIADFDTLLRVYSRHFSAVTALDYDAEMDAGNGNIIPSFLRAIGVDPAGIPHDYRANVS